MLVEITNFIERLKSEFHLDEIEKSTYFQNQKRILKLRLEKHDEKIAELNERLNEPEGTNGGFKVSSKTVPTLMAITVEKDKQKALKEAYENELSIFQRACKLKIQENRIHTYSSEQIAEKPKKTAEDEFIYTLGDKIYLFKSKIYDLLEMEFDWFTEFTRLLLNNKCLWIVLSEDYEKIFEIKDPED